MKFDRTELDHLYRYCLALCGQADDAYDLLQDAIEKYLGQTEKSISQPRAYIKKIARNHFYDQLRKTRRVQFDVLEDHGELESTEEDLESMMADEQTLMEVWKALTAPEREVVFLWAVEGQTAEEIASQLGLPRATVLSRLSRLRTRIGKNKLFASDGGGYV